MEITNYREINKGCVKAAFTICIQEWGGLEIDAVYFEKDDGKFWVNYAAKEYKNKEGQTKSYNQVRFSPETIKRLNTAIRDKIKKGEYSGKSSSEEGIPF